MNEAEYDALRAFECDRWARQANVLRAWLAALPDQAPIADALAQTLAGLDVPNAALAQMRFDLERDAQRLQAAIDGRTPTAVDRTMDYGTPQGFARHEAVHTLDNAVTFLRKALGAQTFATGYVAAHRAQRWLQRLRWELVDTGVAVHIPTDVTARIVADTNCLKHCVAQVLDALESVRAQISRGG